MHDRLYFMQIIMAIMAQELRALAKLLQLAVALPNHWRWLLGELLDRFVRSWLRLYDPLHDRLESVDIIGPVLHDALRTVGLIQRISSCGE